MNKKLKILLSLAPVFCLAIASTSCGSANAAPSPTTTTPPIGPPPPVAALSCSAPSIFKGADDGVQNAIAIFTLCNAANLPASGSFRSDSIDVVYTLQHPFTVGSITSWLGTPTGSQEEVAGEFSIEVPTSVAGVYQLIWIVSNQLDKHQDVIGSHFEHFTGSRTLPAGSRLHFNLNIGIADTAKHCPAGCGQQLNIYLNGN